MDERKNEPLRQTMLRLGIAGIGIGYGRGIRGPVDVHQSKCSFFWFCDDDVDSDSKLEGVKARRRNLNQDLCNIEDSRSFSFNCDAFCMCFVLEKLQLFSFRSC